MKRLPQILMVLAGLGLLTLFVFPMWRITLIAPQYPKGVSMFIYINKIGGTEPGTLQNVNILNHYVGMKKIEPDAIPELKYFPFVILGMTLLAFVAAAINKGPAFWTWTFIMCALAIAGMYDFYLWEYDYGHTISPTAPIKIPGASFQPPVFGSKVILNFIAKSYPHIGGYFAAFSIFLGALAGYLKYKMNRNEKAINAIDVAHMPDVVPADA